MKAKKIYTWDVLKSTGDRRFESKLDFSITSLSIT